MNVEVVRSARRRKTVEARLVDGVLRLAIPAHLSADEEAHWVAVMRERFDRKRSTEGIDLRARAARLASRLNLPNPATIAWSDRQQARWGSCTPQRRSIRVSNRLAAYPDWVLDYVIVHELAHLVVDGHTTEFWALVNRYQLAERARGYLLAKGDGGE